MTGLTVERGFLARQEYETWSDLTWLAGPTDLRAGSKSFHLFSWSRGRLDRCVNRAGTRQNMLKLPFCVRKNDSKDGTNATAFTLIPFGIKFLANDLVKLMIAPLVEA